MKNCTASNSVQTWFTACCDVGTFLMHTGLAKTATNTTARNLVCSQAMRLPCQNLQVNVTLEHLTRMIAQQSRLRLGMGVRGTLAPPRILKFDIFLRQFQQKKLFLFQESKTKFYQFWLPPEK